MPKRMRDEGNTPGRQYQAPGPGLPRRTLLKAMGATAALVPGFAVLDGSMGRQSASAAPLAQAAPLVRDARGGPAITLGGAPVRPPSVPLAVRSPYLSTWLPATGLAATTPQFWYGSNRGFAGLIMIDGQVYAWAGQPEVNGATPPAMTQTSLDVTATRSVFTLQAGGVELVAEWLSPIEPGDLRRQSAPFTLLTVSVRAIDGGSHPVQVYADITGEWASSDESAIITWQTSTTSDNRYWSVQLQTQQPLTENTQMAQWGSAVWGSPLAAGQTYQSGYAVDVRNQFATAGRLTGTSDPDFRAIDDDQPAFAFACDLGTVRASPGTASFAIGHVRTPLVSYGADATPLTPLWTSYWSGWAPMADEFLGDAAAARARAAALDTQIQTAATRAGGPGYPAICALAARQCYGGVELAIGPDGRPWLMGKEISSDGDVNTVDIFDQAYLAWLWLDPGIIPLEMEPILEWCASPGWQQASLWAGIPSWEDSRTRYCVHDLGVYPVASGRAPGNGEQMPIEESAGMLIMAASYARRVGAAAARPFLVRWQMLWTQWAEYLLTQVPTPATQLTTDDWAPVYTTPTGSVNLGIKAIIGLAAAGQIATILGDTTNAAKWTAAAEDNVAPWVSLSTDPSGDYLNLEQGAPGTWTTVYNAYYQTVIGARLVPEPVAAMQASFYLTQLTTYGMPLQTDAGDISKVAWLLYVPAWLRDYPIATELLNRDVAYINDTPSLVPYGDRYHTQTGVEVTGVEAHPTLGAVFALMFAAEPPVTTSVSPASLLLSPGQAGKVTLTNTNSSGGPLTADWAAAPPSGSGITVTPASGSAPLARGARASTPLTVAASSTAAPGPVTVPINVTGHAGGTSLPSPGSYLQITVPYLSLAAAFGNVGITDDSDPGPGNFDGYGNSFSATALADVGITPGSQVTSGGVTFTWPNVAAGQPDNVVASGQTLAMSGAGSTLGFLGAADNGVASGTGTIAYADGSTQSFTIGFQNWIESSPTGDDTLVATTSYFNRTTSGPARTPSLFAASVPLQAGLTVAYVTLPDVSGTTVSSSTRPARG
jgi:Domain of unknown function (DUF5127)/Domain of unknown function (DUF4965)/Domain of unknown function (DUF1793)/Domain of unknown function (DUF4964)